MPRSHETTRRHDLLTKAFDSVTIRQLEQPLLDDDVPLMEFAMQSLANEVMDLLDETGQALEGSNIVVLAGGGMNGTDGLGAATLLADAGAQVTVVATGRHLDGPTLARYVAGVHNDLLILDPRARISGTDEDFNPSETAERLQSAIELALDADLIVDAITGIGAHGGLQGIPARLIEGISTAIESDDDDESGPIVVAADIPSGLGVDDGIASPPFLPADETVCFGALKAGILLPPACDHVGLVQLVDLGFDLDHITPAVELADSELASFVIQPPEADDMKYSRGVVGLVTGSKQYPGAAVLSVGGAARSGAGMVRYVGPEIAQHMVLARFPEVVLGEGRVESWVVGCGVDASEGLAHSASDLPEDSLDEQVTAIESIVKHYDDTKSPDADNPPHGLPPICVDAGAIDLLNGHVLAHVVITPHAGELARLLGRLGEQVSPGDVLASPLYWASRAHELTGATVLLKGATTIVVGEDEAQRPRVLVSKSAPAWLATAGAGDVLAGDLGGLLAQQGEGAFNDDPELAADVAASAAYVHGRAAAIASHCGIVASPTVHLIGSNLVSGPGVQTYDSDFDEQTDPRVPTAPPIGRPIIADDVIAAIPKAIERIIE